MREQADLAVLIVTWNNASVIDACLRSLAEELQASKLRGDVLIIDNASTDGTPDLVRNRYPWVRVMALPANEGFARANNRGIRATSAPALLLLNPDTVLLPGALSALWRALWAAPHIGLVGACLLNPDGSLQSAGYRFPGFIQNFFDFFPLHQRLIGSRFNGRFGPGDGLTPFAIDHPLGACMLVRREAVDQVGLLDERYFYYSEEIDWCRRMRAHGWTVLTAPAARVIHYGGWSSRQVSTASLLQLHRSRARYFRRWHGRRFVRVLWGLALLATVRAWLQALVSPRRQAQRVQLELLHEIARIYADAARTVDDD